MRQTLDTLLENNRHYAETFGPDRAALTARPARRLAVLTCMDARLALSRILGTAEGDAHFIRNAGGRASDDAIRSLVISYRLLGTRAFVVMHHTDCGMAKISDENFRALLAETGPNAASAAQYVNWLTISDPAQSLLEDVTRIRNHPLIPGDIPIFGLTYDVKTGLLHELEAATVAGAPR